MDVRLNPGYRPHPHQVRLHRSGARFLCAAAGVRGGKTKGGAAEFCRRIAGDVRAGRGNRVIGHGRKRRPRLHYWIVSPTGDLLKEPFRYLFESVPEPWVERYYADDTSVWLKGDILIEGKGADRPNSLVSVGLNGLWADEAARLKPDAWRGNLRPRLSDHRGWGLFTTTPLGKNWLYGDIVSRSGQPGFEDYATVAWRTIDNPAIDPAEVAAAKRDLPLRYYLREYEASFEAFIGNVFDEWDPTVHVFDRQPDPRAFRRVVLAMDFGWTAPGCLLVIGDTGGRLQVVDEVYRPYLIFRDERLEEQAGPIVADVPRPTWVGECRRMMARWCQRANSAQIFYDPAEPDKGHDLTRSGLFASPARNDIVHGIRRVAEALHPIGGRAALTIWRGCENLLREIPAYQWAQTRTNELLDLPADGQSDHAIDPLRYGVVEMTEYMDLARPDVEPARIVPINHATLSPAPRLPAPPQVVADGVYLAAR